MTETNRLLVLGGGEGWHCEQLRAAADRHGCEMKIGTYESLSASIRNHECAIQGDAGPLSGFDAILTRTMPAGTLESITFRLATLHSIREHHLGIALVNPPRSLEIAIDKFATLSRVALLGYPVPATRVVQSRREAFEAFDELGGDCVVKPIFGGEGRGVMRIRDRELAWYTFATLDSLGAVAYVQQFVRPGGRDTRLLVIGDEVFGFRRTNDHDFRTNRIGGGRSESIQLSDANVELAKTICRSIDLKFAAVDLLDCQDGSHCVLEVNGIPGWRAAQQVSEVNIADRIVQMLIREASTRRQAAA